MVDIANKEKIILEMAEMLEDHKAKNVTALNVLEQNSWTDFFIIASVNSQGHMKGILKAIKTQLEENNIHFNNRFKKIDDYSWTIIDCGFFVIHLMDEEAREFYELEKLWFKGINLYSSKS